MRLDLHVHSTASDGQLTPEAVVEAAAAGRLDVIALADHDTTRGVPRALDAARDRNIHVIPAIEVTSSWRGNELHILGYFVDPGAEALRRHDENARSGRARRMEGMVERLRRIGVPIAMEDVLAQTSSPHGILSRPHLARALVAAGHVESVSEAFERYIGEGGPAFLPTEILEPGEAVHLVLAAAGIPVWAHPPLELVEPLLPTLVREGLRGLEVYRLRTPADQWSALEELARENGLLVTGGSDWHGPQHGTLGEFYVTREQVADFLDAGGL